MRLPRAFSALAGACLLVLACPVRAAWHAQEEIPVESPVYRLLDAKRRALVYLVYTDRIIEGSPRNSISVVPLAAK